MTLSLHDGHSGKYRGSGRGPWSHTSKQIGGRRASEDQEDWSRWSPDGLENVQPVESGVDVHVMIHNEYKKDRNYPYGAAPSKTIRHDL